MADVIKYPALRSRYLRIDYLQQQNNIIEASHYHCHIHSDNDLFVQDELQRNNELPLNGEPHAFLASHFIAFALAESLVVYSSAKMVLTPVTLRSIYVSDLI